jgi:peptidoglycan biosynthesis protein MviN/MurJ (putative lipid II flippase)
MALTIPLNYILTRQLGGVGTALSNVIALTIYNSIRYLFLLKKFKMQPFNIKTVYTILLTTGLFFICFWLFNTQRGFWWIILRSSVFITLFAMGMFLLKLTPDAVPVLLTVKKRLGFDR